MIHYRKRHKVPNFELENKKIIINKMVLFSQIQCYVEYLQQYILYIVALLSADCLYRLLRQKN